MYINIRVHEYRHKFRGYRVMEPSQAQQQQGDQLNSCGNSVCSDDEETSDTSLDMVSISSLSLPVFGQ